MTPDDDDPHGEEIDPVLRSMRSVWVSMRDEDPPASGLAELLAAARVKAEAMKPAPWWQRMFAVLVKPPVLAAATVVVLIGGGIVISQRSKDLVEQPTASPATSQVAPEPAATAEMASDAATTIRGPDDLERQAAAVDPPAPPPPPPPPRRERPVKDQRADPPKLAPAPDPIPEQQQPPPPPVDSEGGVVTGRAPTGGETLEIAGDSGQDEAKQPAPEPATVKQTQRRGGQPPVDQLVKQAEVAASRKDCGAVRVTVNRIKQIDQTVYRERVIKQPAIANCLK